MTQEKGKPIILSEGTHTPADLARLRKDRKIWEERDAYRAQSEEIFEIENPNTIFEKDFKEKKRVFVEKRLAGQENALKGNWVYYPWSGILLHTVTEEEHFALIGNRNRNIITKEEHERLRIFRVGIVGLSVGSNIATALAYGGIARTLKLAEFDTLETTNLNRIRARIDQVGMSKMEILAQQLYEVNPYADLTYFQEGLTKDSLDRFVLEDPKPELIFEIIDSFEMKIHLRALAKEHGIPVIMTTNLGDRLLMDVERYDLDRDTELFNGRAGKLPDTLLKNPDITTKDKHRYAVLLAGGEKNIPAKVMRSVEAIGKTLVGRPQLGSTVTVSGGMGSYLARKIALGDTRIRGSWLIDFDMLFTPGNLFDLSREAHL